MTSSRYSVRTIASTISQAWWARKVTSKRDLRAAPSATSRAERAQVAALGDAGAPRQRAPASTGSSVGSAMVEQDEAGPDERGRQRQGPAGQRAPRRRPAPTACGAGCRASSSSRSPARRAVPAGPVAPAEDPRQQLPVAARPAMLARRRHVVVRRELLDHLDVGDRGRRGRRCPRTGRGSAACSRARGRRSAASNASTS